MRVTIVVYTRKVMRGLPGAFVLLLTASWLLPAQSPSKRPAAAPKKPATPPIVETHPNPPPVKTAPAAPATERLTYDVEWRLIHAGTAVVEWQKRHAEMKLDSAGMVSTLFKVHDVYTVNYDEPFCVTSSLMDSFEGKRHHETRVTYDRARNHAVFLERDLVKNSVIRSSELEVPGCVHEVLGALHSLRGMMVEPGQSVQLPVSDGRRTAPVKIEAQEREEVKTPAGTFKTVRYEVALLNGVVYTRKGRVFIWVTDDTRRLPVQIKLRMQFPIGTVTLQLQKEEHL
jgi:hypothetical protein